MPEGLAEGCAGSAIGRVTADVRIEAESDAHRPFVIELTRAAFGGGEEVSLIERLTSDGMVVASLVASIGGKIAGHILFGKLDVDVGGRKVNAVALAPLAVLPDYQRKGIASALVEAGLDTVRKHGVEAVIVLGHEDFYPRFGFDHALVSRLDCPFTRHEAFMGLELVPGVLGGRSGVCAYPPAFGM